MPLKNRASDAIPYRHCANDDRGNTSRMLSLDFQTKGMPVFQKYWEGLPADMEGYVLMPCGARS